jgi:ABC-type iron transport system FetAB permease component
MATLQPETVRSSNEMVKINTLTSVNNSQEKLIPSVIDTKPKVRSKVMLNYEKAQASLAITKTNGE